MYSKSGWYMVEDRLWAHMKGRCVRANRTSRTWYWWAEPNGAEKKKCSTLKEAKQYVLDHGAHQQLLKNDA